MKSSGVVVRGLFLASSSLAIGCGELPEQAGEELGTDLQPITGGELMTSGQHVAPHTSAVKLEFNDGFVLHTCSGIKISSTAFWTAGHCTASIQPGDTVRVTNRRDGAFSGTGAYTRTVSSVAVHPSLLNAYKMLGQGRFPANYDVSRVTLSTTTPDIPSSLSTDAAWVGPDQSVTYTGYGCDWEDSTHSGRKQWANFVLENHNEAAAIGKGLDYYTHYMIDIGSSPQGCSGDSGSPVWRLIGSTLRQVGIVVHGEAGYTGFARYSNVRNWLASPAYNLFQVGFQGFIFNHYTGRCISRSVASGHREADCDGRDQNFDFQSWRLANSGFPGSFYLINGSSGMCLDLETTAAGSRLVDRTCLPTSQLANNTQRWRFDTTVDPEYRRLINTTTGRCTQPSSPTATGSSVLVSQACTSISPPAPAAWRHQAWMMTR